MLIVSNVKEEGIFNLEHMTHLHVKYLKAEDGDYMYSLMYSGLNSPPGFIGQWKTKDKAENALEEIIKSYHLGLRDVYLHD